MWLQLFLGHRIIFILFSAGELFIFANIIVSNPRSNQNIEGTVPYFWHFRLKNDYAIIRKFGDMRLNNLFTICNVNKYEHFRGRGRRSGNIHLPTALWIVFSKLFIPFIPQTKKKKTEARNKRQWNKEKNYDSGSYKFLLTSLNPLSFFIGKSNIEFFPKPSLTSHMFCDKSTKPLFR